MEENRTQWNNTLNDKRPADQHACGIMAGWLVVEIATKRRIPTGQRGEE